MAKVTKKMQEAFDLFEVEIPILIEDLQELLKDSVNYRDVKAVKNLDTVDRVESFYLDVLAGKEKVNVSEEHLNRILIAYFGESLIQHAGGHWELCDLKSDNAYGTPIILGWEKDPESIRVCPVEIREHLRKERKRSSMRETIEYCANKEQFEAIFLRIDSSSRWE